MGRAWQARLDRTIHEDPYAELFLALDFRSAVIQKNEYDCCDDRDYKEWGLVHK